MVDDVLISRYRRALRDYPRVSGLPDPRRAAHDFYIDYEAAIELPKLGAQLY